MIATTRGDFHRTHSVPSHCGPSPSWKPSTGWRPSPSAWAPRRKLRVAMGAGQEHSVPGVRSASGRPRLRKAESRPGEPKRKSWIQQLKGEWPTKPTQLSQKTVLEESCYEFGRKFGFVFVLGIQMPFQIKNVINSQRSKQVMVWGLIPEDTSSRPD